MPRANATYVNALPSCCLSPFEGMPESYVRFMERALLSLYDLWNVDVTIRVKSSR